MDGANSVKSKEEDFINHFDKQNIEEDKPLIKFLTPPPPITTNHVVKEGETLAGIVNTLTGDSYEQTVEAARAGGVELLDVNHWAARFNTNADAIIAKMGSSFKEGMQFVELQPGDHVYIQKGNDGLETVRVVKAETMRSIDQLIGHTESKAE